MEIDSTNQENVGGFTKWCNKFMDFPRKFKHKVEKAAKNTKQIGKDDPRKIWHALKVALALTLVSLIYYTEPLFESFDQPAMWAVLTVVVVFEFTVGATISKSVNRGFGTGIAGAFGLGAKYLAEVIGKKDLNPIVLGVMVFIVGALGTFTRFYPKIKRKYDYGTMIFVLTFSLVAVSGYRSEDIILLAVRRICTILIGISTVMTISMVICPVWAGDDLHKLVYTDLEKLANFLEGFGDKYFHNFEIENNEKEFLEAFLSDLGSKATEESLANLAWWEPPHGSFYNTYPWKLYLKIGDLVRKCASHLLALGGHLNSKSQAPTEFERRIEESCKEMIIECCDALNDLALSIKTMTKPISSIVHIRIAKSVIDDLKFSLGTSKIFFRNDESCVMDFVPAASVVSLLIAVTECVDEIFEAVEELSGKARFGKKVRRNERRRRYSCSTEPSSSENPPPSQSHRPQMMHHATVNPVLERDDFVTIVIDDNVESTERVLVEEANRVNNNPTKKGEFMSLADVELSNSTQFFESAEGGAILEEANRLNNSLAARKGGSIVIGIRGNTTTTIMEEMKTTKKKGEVADLADAEFHEKTHFLESTLVTAKAIVKEMQTTEKKEELMNSTDAKLYDNTQFLESSVIEVNQK